MKYTPTPWIVECAPRGAGSGDRLIGKNGMIIVDSGISHEDAAFIVQAVNELSKSQSRIKELTEELEVEKGKGLEHKEWWWKGVEETNVVLQNISEKLREENEKLKSELAEAVKLLKRVPVYHIMKEDEPYISCFHCRIKELISRHEKGEKP